MTPADRAKLEALIDQGEKHGSMSPYFAGQLRETLATMPAPRWLPLSESTPEVGAWIWLLDSRPHPGTGLPFVYLYQSPVQWPTTLEATHYDLINPHLAMP